MLRRDLRRLPAMDRDLEELLDPRRTGTGIGHGSGDGLPYHDPAAECRSQIRHDLMVWTRWIADERGTEPPVTMAPPEMTAVELAAMAGWITGLIRWCTFRPWSGDLAAAMASNRSTAMAIIDPKPRADITIPQELNYCPRCETMGQLEATIYQADGDRRPSVVTCHGCEYEWPVASWIRLGKTIITWRDQQKAA